MAVVPKKARAPREMEETVPIPVIADSMILWVELQGINISEDFRPELVFHSYETGWD